MRLDSRRACPGWALFFMVLHLPLAPREAGGQDVFSSGLTWRSIGPVGQGGRVDDIAVVESDPSTFFVGFATGGLWKTINNGTTFRPVFDTYGTHSVGDVSVSQSNPEIVYVGTGEANNRQSSSFGDGVYKSTDGGETFSHVGLRATQSIARVVVHPTDPEVVWVAAVGPLFGASGERGVFKSTDGGTTWAKTLFVDDDTGVTDLVIQPDHPNTLLAATYQRRRSPWGFVGGGPGSGLWRSDDGGETWSPIRGNGLPSGTMGRIALGISRSHPNVVYAQIDVAPDDEPPVDDPQGGFRNQQDEPPDPSVAGTWRSDDGGRTWRFLNNHNPRPMYFSQIRVDPTDPDIVYTGGVDIYKSVDGGGTFFEVDTQSHVDHHAIWIDPNDSDHIMIGNDGSLDVSWDQGDTWESLRTWAVGQSYHTSTDMRRPYYVCTGLQDNGTWCGPSSVRSDNILPEDWYRVGRGDGFYSAIDRTDWTVVYSESQYGNIRRIDLETGVTERIRPRGPSGQERAGGIGGGTPGNIVPETGSGFTIRWNWNTPFILSPHNPNVIYAGGNRLFASLDRGTTWTMSEDLTKGLDPSSRDIMGRWGDEPRCSRRRVGPCILSRNDGVREWGTIVSISASARVPDLLWVGTDDGNVQLSRDGGISWTEVGQNVPGGTREYYVSRVEASHHEPGTAYASLDGHRHNDLRPYLFVTRDYGLTWRSISSDLPAHGSVKTIRQDPVNPSLLYAGTEFGFYVSLDEGRRWRPLMDGLPVVRADDVLVHPRDNDLVLATHGRSVWIMDDVTPLQQLTREVMAENVFLMQPREAVVWKGDLTRSRAVTGWKVWEGENAPAGTAIAYYLGVETAGRGAELTITRVGTGEAFRRLEATNHPGLNIVRWDLCSDRRAVGPGRRTGSRPTCEGGGGGGRREVSYRATPGLYRVTLSAGGEEHTREVSVIEDVWLGVR